MVALIAWLLLAAVLVFLGKLCDSQVCLAIGGALVLMLAMVDKVAW